MNQVLEAFRMCISLEAFFLHLMAFQNILHLLPATVTPSNEVLLIRTPKPGSNVH
jgi:hypothetical protein